VSEKKKRFDTKLMRKGKHLSVCPMGPLIRYKSLIQVWWNFNVNRAFVDVHVLLDFSAG
jgi:hypothetical protein